jgi:hypothetical protein
MTSEITPPADSKASRMMRQAILHELQCPPSDPDAPAADKLQQVARSLVNKAAQGDVSAIKEVLDRIDGKTAAGATESDDGPTRVNVGWGKPK